MRIYLVPIDHVRSKAWHFITSLKCHVKTHPPFFEGKRIYGEMASEQFNSLDYLAKRRYLEKLNIDGEDLPDPYSISDDLWMDDMTQWPDLQYGDVYSYLIDTKGAYTKETLKAYKSLDAYNYFCCGHVRTVYCYRHGNHLIFKALINPSQKTLDQAHKAWVILHTNAEVKTAHCSCKAG